MLIGLVHQVSRTISELDPLEDAPAFVDTWLEHRPEQRESAFPEEADPQARETMFQMTPQKTHIRPANQYAPVRHGGYGVYAGYVRQNRTLQIQNVYHWNNQDIEQVRSEQIADRQVQRRDAQRGDGHDQLRRRCCERDQQGTDKTVLPTHLQCHLVADDGVA